MMMMMMIEGLSLKDVAFSAYASCIAMVVVFLSSSYRLLWGRWPTRLPTPPPTPSSVLATWCQQGTARQIQGVVRMMETMKK
jgi:hypothetical protein